MGRMRNRLGFRPRMAGYLQVTWSVTANLTCFANFVQVFCPETLAASRCRGRLRGVELCFWFSIGRSAGAASRCRAASQCRALFLVFDRPVGGPGPVNGSRNAPRAYPQRRVRYEFFDAFMALCPKREESQNLSFRQLCADMLRPSSDHLTPWRARRLPGPQQQPGSRANSR
jgi:hypothetical protein